MDWDNEDDSLRSTSDMTEQPRRRRPKSCSLALVSLILILAFYALLTIWVINQVDDAWAEIFVY